MADQVGHIKNPLTVISRFAAIAEISGTAVLPFISPENQATYIWFLMIFPVLLVGTFFLTLNFNHKTLYAPSDYQNQNHFLNLFGIVTPSEHDEKLNAEVKEAAAPTAESSDSYREIVRENPIDTPQAPDKSVDEKDGDPAEMNEADSALEAREDELHSSPEKRFDFDELSKRSTLELKTKLNLIERLSIKKLKEATSIPFSERVKFEIPGLSKPIIFDAIADQGDTIHIVEIKYFTDNKLIPTRFSETIQNASLAAKNIANVSNKKVLLHLIGVLDERANEARHQNFHIMLRNMANNFNLPCRVYIATVDQLEAVTMPANWARPQNIP